MKPTKLNNLLKELKYQDFNVVTHGAVVAIITNKEGKYLIIQRSSQDEDGASLWDFAGGSCDIDDVESDCIREILEETGLSIAPETLQFHKHCPYVCPWKNEDKVSFIFLAEGINSDDVKLSHEHDNYKWVSYKEMLQYLFYKENLPGLIREVEVDLMFKTV